MPGSTEQQSGFCFKVGEPIYYMYQNKAVTSTVACRRRVDTTNHWTKFKGEATKPFGETRVEYYTDDGQIVQEADAFKSKADLVASL